MPAEYGELASKVGSIPTWSPIHLWIVQLCLECMRSELVKKAINQPQSNPEGKLGIRSARRLRAEYGGNCSVAAKPSRRCSCSASPSVTSPLPPFSPVSAGCKRHRESLPQLFT